MFTFRVEIQSPVEITEIETDCPDAGTAFERVLKRHLLVPSSVTASVTRLESS